jgi:hypothetical protein
MPRHFNHTAVTHVSPSGDRRWACHGNCYQSRALVPLVLSSHRVSPSNSLATAQGPYKLSTPSAPLGIQSSRSCLQLLTREPQFGISPKSVRNTAHSDLAVASSFQVCSCSLLSHFSVLRFSWCSSTHSIELNCARSSGTPMFIRCSRCLHGQGDLELRQCNWSRGNASSVLN